jgi:DNA-binding MarR family transcriptional regulator
MDFDPRDYDSRNEDRFAPTRDRSGGGGADRDDERDNERSQPGTVSRDRDDEARGLGRGPGDSRESHSAERGRDARDDVRRPDRERDERTRDADPREVFTRHLNLPRGLQRQLVRDRDREYALRGSESRTLATVGAFRVVSSRDLRDYNDRPTNPRSGDLRHLREQGLVETIRVPGYREQAVTLTKEGRSLLEHHRDRDQGDRQTFYNGVKRERELEHDVQVYRAYERQAERLAERGARIERVVLDYELKREYQQWLHERHRGRADYDGHPDRTDEEIRQWALEHDLPYFDDEVHFPDLRVEYQEADGRWDRDDVEVVTEHYRGAHGASVARSGFSCYRGSSGRIGGRSSGGSPFDPGLAEDFL